MQIALSRFRNWERARAFAMAIKLRRVGILRAAAEPDPEQAPQMRQVVTLSRPNR